MRVEASAPFIMPTQWNACSGTSMDLRGRNVFGGLDLSAVSDLTALVLVGCDITTGTWHCQPLFWLPAEGLADQGAR
jgi:phage terminase large subunit-like protein